VSTLDEALADTVWCLRLSARHRNLGPPALPAREGSADILARAGEGEVALLFGNETAGSVERRGAALPADGLHPAESWIYLAQPGAAVQLLCYELRLAAFAGSPPVVTQTCLLRRRRRCMRTSSASTRILNG
jgi:tRNA/rRNA methyltransferase